MERGAHTPQATQNVLRPTPPPVVTFGGHNDPCDTLHADEQIRKFREFIAAVISRYDGNVVEQANAERQEQDLKHAIELADHPTDKEKRLLFRNLKNVLKARRACKSENEILQPFYDLVSDRRLYNKLGEIQGAVKNKKDVLSARQYTCRTSALDGFRRNESAG